MPMRMTVEEGRILPDMWPLGVITNFCGASDDLEDGIVGTDILVIESTTQEDKTKTLRFIEPMHLAGGHLQYKGAVLGDHLSFVSKVPATSGTENPGDGSYMKYEVATGCNIFIPYPNGGWDLDLDEPENANVTFPKCRPVPAPGGTGFFNYDYTTNVLTVNATQTGGYNLCDWEVTLAEFITCVPIIGDDHFPLTVPAVRPVLILPQWKHVITMHNSTAKTLQLAAMLYRGRLNPLR